MLRQRNATGVRQVLLGTVASAAMAASAVAGESRHWYASTGIGWNQADSVSFDDARGSVDFDLAAPVAALALGLAVNGNWRVELEASRRSNDVDIEGSSTNFDAFDVGPTVALVAGYRLRPRWRLELEAAYRSNDAELIDYGPAIGEDRATGRVKARSLMANVVFQPRPDGWIRPFIGLGTGYATVDYDVTTRGTTFVDDSDSAFAFQYMFGVDVAVTPRLTFTTDYRFWITDWLKPEQPDGTRLKTDHRVHSMMVGLHYDLGNAR